MMQGIADKLWRTSNFKYMNSHIEVQCDSCMKIREKSKTEVFTFIFSASPFQKIFYPNEEEKSA